MTKVFNILLYLFFFAIYFISVTPISADNAWTLTNITKGDIPYVRVSPSNHRVIYAIWNHINDDNSLNYDLIKSTDGGVSWNSIHNSVLPDNVDDVNSISIDPQNEHHVVVGMYNSGVYETKDGGLSWTLITRLVPHLRSLAIDPNDTNVVYLGLEIGLFKLNTTDKSLSHIAGDSIINTVTYVEIAGNLAKKIILAGTSQKLWKSLDNGTSWTSMAEFNNFGINGSVIVDPVDLNHIYASQGYVRGIWISDNFGQIWSRASNPVDNTNPYDIAIDKNNHSTIYVTTSQFGNLGIFKGTNYGTQWENITGDVPCTNTMGIATTPNYIVLGTSGCGILLRELSSTTNLPTILLPGLGASWSYKGLIENKKTTWKDWQLLPVFTDDYKSLLQTFKNAGLEEGKTLFTFPYDWRQPITISGVWLDQFIKEILATASAGTKVNLIGHSMGGLVGRACVEKVSGCNTNINKFITAGSPHNGLVDVYNMWEGGEIPDKNFLRRSMEYLLLRINGKSFAHSKDIIQNIIPSIRDLLPTFDYISDKNYSHMSQISKNRFLETLGSSNVNPLLTTFVGNTKDTTRTLDVTAANFLETKLGLWIDGKPTNKHTAAGDDTVLSDSGKIPGSAGNFEFDAYHNSLISDDLPKRKILETLGIIPGSIATSIEKTRGLFFILHSPATLYVTDNNFVPVGVKIDEKTTFIENPDSGYYYAYIIGTGTGNVTLEVGSFDALNEPSWISANDRVVPGTYKPFIINYNKNKPLNITLYDSKGLTNLTMAKNKIQNLAGGSNKDFLNRVNKAINYVSSNKNALAKVEIESLYERISSQISKTEKASIRRDLDDIGNHLVNAYEIVVKNGSISISQNLVTTEKTRATKTITAAGNKYSSITPTVRESQNFLDAGYKLQKANTAIASQLLPRALLLARSVQFYF